MPTTALITGASSGIGAAFARYHAAKGGDLVIVARRRDALEALKSELEAAHGVRVSVFAQDLGSAEHAAALYEAIAATGAEIDILINNAGFGGHGAFLERDLAQDLAMIDLNISALVTLSHHVGGAMKARGGGKMLQVASTAGFIPGPYQAVYFATKAFVTSFSQAIDQEMRRHGVTSTALCPGLVNTEFVATADLEGTGLSKQKGASAASVAKIGYEAMLRGELIVINERRLSFMLNWLVPLLPRRQVLKMTESMQMK